MAKLSPLEKQWRAEIKRIEKTIARYEQKGYTFERLKVPSQPKKITEKSVERVKALTTEEILRKGNVQVGNRTYHIPTAKKKGLIKDNDEK